MVHVWQPRRAPACFVIVIIAVVCVSCLGAIRESWAAEQRDSEERPPSSNGASKSNEAPEWNVKDHPSGGSPCPGGESAAKVPWDGSGTEQATTGESSSAACEARKHAPRRHATITYTEEEAGKCRARAQLESSRPEQVATGESSSAANEARKHPHRRPASTSGSDKEARKQSARTQRGSGRTAQATTGDFSSCASEPRRRPPTRQETITCKDQEARVHTAREQQERGGAMSYQSDGRERLHRRHNSMGASLGNTEPLMQARARAMTTVRRKGAKTTTVDNYRGSEDSPPRTSAAGKPLESRHSSDEGQSSSDGAASERSRGFDLWRSATLRRSMRPPPSSSMAPEGDAAGCGRSYQVDGDGAAGTAATASVTRRIPQGSQLGAAKSSTHKEPRDQSSGWQGFSRLSKIFKRTRAKQNPEELPENPPTGAAASVTPSASLAPVETEGASGGTVTHPFFTSLRCTDRPLVASNVLEELLIIRECLKQLRDGLKANKSMLSHRSPVYLAALADVNFLTSRAQELEQQDLETGKVLSRRRPRD